MSELSLETFGATYSVSLVSGEVFASRGCEFRVRSAIRLARGECCTIKNERQQQVECFVCGVEEDSGAFIITAKCVPLDVGVQS